ncbi:MAG: hypothetical protein MI740_10490 [Halanaerobiales bacterium]|nr:hypothetical protein [Halanaerobiales bacterium]
MDKIRPISKIDELEPTEDGALGFDKYAICYEIIKDKKYKNRKGKNETSLFLNGYCNVQNGDIAVLWFMSEVANVLDETDLSNVSIKTYKIVYADSNPTPQYNKRLQAWQAVIKVDIRWESV